MTPAVCHPDRPNKARGDCESCYRRKRRGTFGQRWPGDPPTCHPDREYAGRGLCSACYARSRRQLPECHPDRRASGRNRRLCVDCYHAQVTVPQKREQRRAGHLRRLYELTPEQYDELLAAQGGVCAICQEPPHGDRLHVDHDHRTGRIRGLLCQLCNRALGALRDRPDLAEAAAAYLASVAGERMVE